MKGRPEFDRFFRAALLAAVGRSRWLLLVFLIFVVLLEVVANLVYDVVVLGQPLTQTLAIRTAALVGGLVVAAAACFTLDLIQTRSGEHDIDETTNKPHPGLIWLLSPHNPEPLLKVMQHHANPQAQTELRMRHCWVILSDHPAMESTYDSLTQEMDRWGIQDVALHPVHLPRTGIQETYRAVIRIYEDEIGACGLKAGHVVTDLTGGLKIMTAGALMACLTASGKSGPIEYLLSERDPITGEPIEGSERPMKLDVAFFPRREEQG
jgi:hypothetical protein